LIIQYQDGPHNPLWRYWHVEARQLWPEVRRPDDSGNRSLRRFLRSRSWTESWSGVTGSKWWTASSRNSFVAC